MISNKSKLRDKLLLLVASISIVGITLILRWIFFQKTDYKYLDDLYSFSQWSIPMSSRIMGDSSLYQYSGIQISKGANPFEVNPETPIFGKLLMGTMINITGNPHIFSIFSLLLLLVILNITAKRFLKLNNWHRSLLLLLIGTSPIILEQVSNPLLDLPQTTLFFAHLYFLFLIGETRSRQRNTFYIIASGVFLGLMMATKIALYLPLILIINTWYLWKKNKLSYLPIIILPIVFTYAFTYSDYISKYGIISWAKAQKWIINFYRNSDVVTAPGMIFITALTGWYKGWWGSGWERVATWSGSWALGIFVTLSKTGKINKTKASYEEKYLIVIALSILGLLIFIPFWPRYFVFLIPIFWINTISWLKNKKAILLLLIFPLLHTLILAKNSLEFNPTNFYSLWEKAAYSDMYDYLSEDYKTKNSKIEWNMKQQEKIESISVFSISLEQKDFTINKSVAKTQKIKVVETGPKQINISQYELKWKLERSQWKIDSIKKVDYEEENIKSDDTNSLCVNPTKAKDLSDVYTQAANLLNTTRREISKRTMNLIPKDYCIPIGALPKTTLNNSVTLEQGLIILPFPPNPVKLEYGQIYKIFQ